MRWRPKLRRQPRPTQEAASALEQAHRALDDAKALDRYAVELERRADVLSDRWQETRRVNHLADGVWATMTRKAHP